MNQYMVLGGPEMIERHDQFEPPAEPHTFFVESPNEIGAGIQQYVRALQQGMEISPEDIQKIKGIRTPEKLAAAVHKNSSPVKLEFARWGHVATNGTSTEQADWVRKNNIPENRLTATTEAALVLEAAARHQLIAEADLQSKNLLDTIARFLAKNNAKKYMKEAEELLRNGKVQETSAKAKTAKRLVFISFVLAACGITPSPDVGATQPVATESSPDSEPTVESNNSEPVVVPTAISDEVSKLASAGFRIEQNNAGWALVDRSGAPSVSATEAPNMISIPLENGEEMEVSAENYEVREVNVIGLSAIQVIKDAQGNVERFFLDKERVWVTPIEIYNNFENLDQCPEISIEDVWNGRLLYSEALALTPFSSTALESEGFVYKITQASGGYNALLHNQINGQLDEVGNTALSINKNNDYRDFMSCAFATTPNGTKILIGGEAIQMKGKKIALMHYDWGEEVSWTDGHPYASQAGGTLYSVQDSFLLARKVPSHEGYNSSQVRPVISFDFPNINDINKAYGHVEEGDPDTAGVALYSLPQNNPLANYPETQEQIVQMGKSGENGIVPASTEQVAAFQYMLFIAERFPKGRIAPDSYFNPAN